MKCFCPLIKNVDQKSDYDDDDDDDDKVVLILENIVDPDEIQHYAAFHLGLHCLQKKKDE